MADDLQATFVNVYQSVSLLYERGHLLDDLEKKSENLAERGEQLNPRTPCYRTTWRLLVGWIRGAWGWLMATAFCRALRGDSSMNRSLKILK